MISRINIQSFKGSALRPYLPSIAKVRQEVYREYPYLQEIDIEEEKKYLEEHLDNKEAIAVLVFDGSAIVGVSTGTPLENESEIIQAPFIKEGLDICSFYYFGKSFLLKTYRGRGFGHHFFDLREYHARNVGSYHYICFSTIARQEKEPPEPKEYMPLDSFWKKRGYVPHPEMQYKLTWKDLSETEPSEKPMIIWTKDLP